MRDSRKVIVFLEFLTNITTDDKEINRKVKNLIKKIKERGLTEDTKKEIKEIVTEVYGSNADKVIKSLPI